MVSVSYELIHLFHDGNTGQQSEELFGIGLFFVCETLAPCQREVDLHLSLDVHGISVQQIGPVLPLLNSVDRCRSEQGMSADELHFVDITFFVDFACITTTPCTSCCLASSGYVGLTLERINPLATPDETRTRSGIADFTSPKMTFAKLGSPDEV